MKGTVSASGGAKGTRSAAAPRKDKAHHPSPTPHSRSAVITFRNCLLESICYWFYFIYATAAVRACLLFPAGPVRHWSPVLQTFPCAFIVDYVYRKLLSAGNPVDPFFGVLRGAIDNRQSRGEAVSIFAACLSSGLVVLQVSRVTVPVQFASWKAEQGALACCVVEFLCSLLHYVRASLLLAHERELSHLENVVGRRLRFQQRGLDALNSYVTASVIALGGFFTNGGPMLNLTYLAMASLQAADAQQLVNLALAQLAAVVVAGNYAQYQIDVTTQKRK